MTTITTNIVKISDRLSIVHYIETNNIGLSDSATGQEVFFADYTEAQRACSVIWEILLKYHQSGEFWKEFWKSEDE